MARTNEFKLRNSNDAITLNKAVRINAKIVGATLAKGLGILSGTTKAVAYNALQSEKGGYIDDCLSYSNKAHYRGAEQQSFSYVNNVFKAEKTKETKEQELNDL